MTHFTGKVWLKCGGYIVIDEGLKRWSAIGFVNPDGTKVDATVEKQSCKQSRSGGRDRRASFDYATSGIDHC